MPDTKVSDEVTAGALDGTELLYCVQAGAPRKVTVDTVIARSANPPTNDGRALGTNALQWSDLFLAAGAVVNFGGGDVTLTHSANALAFAGASNGYSFDKDIKPTASGTIHLGSATLGWANLFFGNLGSVINFGNGDITITHTTDALTFSGAGNGFKFGSPIVPSANDGAALGVSGTAWSDLFLASGAVIDFNTGDVLITHAANALTFSGGSSGYIFDFTIRPLANDGAALGTATLAFSDLFLADGGVINFNNGDVTITHSTDTITFSGASSGYKFGNLIAPSANDGAPLGSTSLMWSDLFLASGAVVNFNNGNMTITHSAGILAVAGGNVNLDSCCVNQAGIPASLGKVEISFNGTAARAVVSKATNNGATDTHFYFLSGASNVGQIITSTTTTTYATSSDAALKEDAKEILDPSELINAIEVWDHKWKGTDTRGVGVFAQDLYDVFPNAVVVGNKVDDTPWMVDYSKLVPLIIAHAKQLDRQVHALNAKVGL